MTSPMADEPANPPLRKGARTRLQILRAAGELFSFQAPASVKIDDIAYSAGVSVGTLYNYFPSKEALLLAFTADAYEVLDRYRDGVRALPSPMQRVYAAGDAYLQFAIERPTFVRFMMARGLQPADDASLTDVNERVSAHIRQLVLEAGVDLRDAMQTGEIPTAPIDEMIIMLFGLWNGMVGLIVRADGTQIPPDLAKRALERSRVLLHRAVAHEFEHPAVPTTPWAASGPRDQQTSDAERA